MRFLTLAMAMAMTVTTANAAERATAIEWRRNLLDAFVEAVENKKPLVVLFASRPSTMFPNGRHLSNEQWVEMDRTEMRSLVGSAVFAICYYDHATQAMLDEYAGRMKAKLRLTTLPTLSVIAPNDQRLVEVYRMEGLFPADEIATELRRKLPTALTAEHLAAELPARPFAKTPTEAFDLWQAKMRAGDPERMGEVLTPAAAETFARCFNAARTCGHAKRRLFAALDDRFGATNNDIPNPDDDELYRQMANVERFELLSVDADGEMATLKTRLIHRDGTNRSVDFLAENGTAGWKLVPTDFAKLMDPIKQKKHLETVKTRAVMFDTIARRVRAGEFATREAAKAALDVTLSKH